MSYLPEQYRRGMVLLRIELGKRRLTPIPVRWREFSDEEITRLLAKATPGDRPRDSTDLRGLRIPDDESRVQG